MKLIKGKVKSEVTGSTFSVAEAASIAAKEGVILGMNNGGVMAIPRAAYADAQQGGTILEVAAAGWNGASVDRLKSVNTGQLVVTPKGSAGSEVIAATGAAVPAGAVMVGGTDGAGATLQTVMVAQLGDSEGARRGWYVNGRGQRYNGTGWDMERNNHTATLFASAARTTTSSSADQTNYNGQGIIVTLDSTAIADTPSVVFTVEAKDPISGTYTTVLTSVAMTAADVTQRLRVGSNITAVANLAAADLIGRTWRVTATHADADSITFSGAGETMTA